MNKGIPSTPAARIKFIRALWETFFVGPPQLYLGLVSALALAAVLSAHVGIPKARLDWNEKFILVFFGAYYLTIVHRGIDYITRRILLVSSRRKQTFFDAHWFRYVSPLSKGDSFVYLVVRHRDGAYKIGKTQDIGRRMQELQVRHGKISLVALWATPGMDSLEQAALAMTAHLIPSGSDDTTELREMTDYEVGWFIDAFTDFVRTSSKME